MAKPSGYLHGDNPRIVDYLIYKREPVNFWELNKEIGDEIEVKTFFFFREHYDFGTGI